MLEDMRTEALGGQVLTIESCDNREHDMRDWLKVKIDTEDKKIARLSEKIIKAMAEYKKDWPLETRDVDVHIAAGPEFKSMLDQLQADDLPRFEGRFKALLNENTIREVANFNPSWPANARPSRSALPGSTNHSPRSTTTPAATSVWKRRRLSTPTSATSRPSCAPVRRERSPARRMRSIRKRNFCRSNASSNGFAAGRNTPIWIGAGHPR